MYGRLTEILGTSKRCRHHFFSSVFIFVCFGGALENMRKKWLMFYWVCLPFTFVWLHLMFPVAFLFVLTPYPQTPSITSDLAASQPFWFSKAPEHETETLNMGQIFILWSSLLTFLYLSKPLRFFLFLYSLIVRVADRHATGNYWIMALLRT